MNDLTEEQIEKLPKWAREAFVDMRRTRDEARKVLFEFLDSQKPQAMYSEFRARVGKAGKDASTINLIRHYVPGYRMVVEWGGVKLEVSLIGGNGIANDEEIRIAWDTESALRGDVILRPISWQQMTLNLPKQTQSNV